MAFRLGFGVHFAYSDEIEHPFRGKSNRGRSEATLERPWCHGDDIDATGFRGTWRAVPARGAQREAQACGDAAG